MTEIYKLFTIFSIGSTLIISVLGFLAKKTIDQILNKDLEKFKNNLQSENEKSKLLLEKEIESYKASLNLIYSKQIQLYTKKTEIIESLYHKLIYLNEAMLNMTIPFRNVTGKSDDEIKEEEIERVNHAAEKGNKFFRFYSKNKIYFSTETCQLIENLQKQFNESHSDYSFQHNLGIRDSDLTFDLAKKASERIRNEIPDLMNQLENDFRYYLGVLDKKIKTATNNGV